MTTFVGATINQPPGASGFALRALKTRKTYTTSWDIILLACMEAILCRLRAMQTSLNSACAFFNLHA
jgi:hypothetical protein